MGRVPYSDARRYFWEMGESHTRERNPFLPFVTGRCKYDQNDYRL